MVKKAATQKKAISKNPGDQTRDRYTAVLEDLRSQFQVFGEGLIGVHEKLDEHTQRFDKVETELGEIKGRVALVETDLVFVKEQLSLIRHNQVTRDEFHLLETRVARLEQVRRE